MKVLIIEDEAPAFRRLQRILEELEPTVEIIDVIDSVSESVKWLRNHEQVDLIFMDIQLADGLSFQIFDQLEVKSPVIFTTAYDEYTLKAFSVNSIDYLLKPIDKDLLKKSLDKYSSMKEVFQGNNSLDLNAIIKSIQLEEKRYKSRFLIKVKDQLVSVETKNIAYFYTEDGLVFIKTKSDKKYIADFTLDELEDLLDPTAFFRLNRQFIAQFDAIESSFQWDKGKLKVALTPNTKTAVLVSRDRANEFKRWLDLF